MIIPSSSPGRQRGLKDAYIESILMPKNASCMDTQTIEDIFSNTDYPRALAWHTDRFDEQLFEHFGLSSTERRYIKEIVMQYRG